MFGQTGLFFGSIYYILKMYAILLQYPAFEGGFSFMFSWERAPCFLYLIQIFGSRERGLLHNGNHIARLVKSFHEILMRFLSYLIWSKKFAAFQFPSNWNNSFVTSKPPKFCGSPNIFFNKILFTFFFNSSKPVLTEKIFVDWPIGNLKCVCSYISREIRAGPV